MKFLSTLLLLMISFSALSQGEFNASSFYKTLLKIRDAGKNGFEEVKGRQLKTEYAELRQEFHPKLMIPLADSGKIIIPKEGVTYAIYYFEPEKKLEKINERAVDLRDAIKTAYGQPLYARTISTTVNNNIYSDTYFYDTAEETHTSRALFRTSVYRQKGKYHLTIEIRGK
jgi:hypothetical protein